MRVEERADVEETHAKALPPVCQGLKVGEEYWLGEPGAAGRMHDPGYFLALSAWINI